MEKVARRWTYKAVSFNLSQLRLAEQNPADVPELIWFLNDLGNMSWELVSSSTVRTMSPPGDKLIMILKKEV